MNRKRNIIGLWIVAGILVFSVVFVGIWEARKQQQIEQDKQILKQGLVVSCQKQLAKYGLSRWADCEFVADCSVELFMQGVELEQAAFLCGKQSFYNIVGGQK